MKLSSLRFMAATLGAALLMTSCSGGGDANPTTSSEAPADTNSSAPATSESAAPGEESQPASNVTLKWWHNSNTGEGKEYYDKVAKDFEAAHPGVKIEISAMQHEDMVTKLEAAWQSGDVPDIYMERGGGELADKVKAGLVKDLSDSAKDEIDKLGGSVAGWQVDGKTYALPFSVGVVGFWYNKALFQKAGITEAPKTQAEFNDAVKKLKDAGIEPISVGAGDKWPAAHYWYYYALRECSKDTLQGAVTSLEFTDGCFKKAGEDLEALIKTEPFNSGFLVTPAQAGPTSASGLLATGKVAMELAGHWEPGVMQGLTEDGNGLGDDTGWFAFPEQDGQQGDPSAALGGGDAWGVPEKSPQEAVEFVKYLLSDEVQKGFAELDMGLPTNPTATGSVSDKNLAELLKVRDAAAYVQLYFDTAFGTAVGGAMNDSIALMFAGQASPQDIVDATQEAADAEK